MGKPEVKARHMKSLLAALDRHPEAAAVRRRLDPRLLAAVEESSGLEWQPLQWNLELTRAVREELGGEGTHAFFRHALLEAFGGPLLGFLVDCAVRVFGIDPASWARWVPRGWALVFRDCGTWSVAESAPGRVAFHFDGVPAACAADRIWLQSVASSLGAIVDLARARGGVELGAVDQAAGRATYVMTWK